jgi:hypothetical protein
VEVEVVIKEVVVEALVDIEHHFQVELKLH